MADKIIRVMPAAFPGFDDTIIEEIVEHPETEAGSAEAQEAASKPEETMEEKVETKPEETVAAPAEASPLALEDNATYVHPLTGRPVKGADLKRSLGQEAAYVRSMQDIAPMRKLVDTYRAVPKFAKEVDRLGAEILGFDGPEPKVDREKLQEQYDVDPLAAVETIVREAVKTLTPAEKPSPKEDPLLVKAATTFGDDWPEVSRKALEKGKAMQPHERDYYDRNDIAMVGLLTETYKEVLLERQKKKDPPKEDKKPDASRAAVSSTGSAASRDSVPKDKRVWDLGKEDFKKKQREVLNRSPAHLF